MSKYDLACYRPQPSCGQGNIFTSVCHSVHRGGGVSEADPPGRHTHPPPRAGTPQTRHPPRTRHPPGRHTPPWQAPPWAGTPLGRHTPQQTPPGPDPPREADASIRSMSGRYASYWNAFLLTCKIERGHMSKCLKV